MFGYVQINKEQLTDEDKKTYQAYYCGLCRRLKSNCGMKGQALLTYDMTFLIAVLTGLYECENEVTEFTCVMHPTKKRQAYVNEITDYAAAMNIILAYENFHDDVRDTGSYAKKFYMHLLDADSKRIAEKYPRQVDAIRSYIEKLIQAEQEQDYNIDKVAGFTGEMLAELFVYREDEWQEELRCLGYYLGKFVYLMDAYDDIEKDKKKQNYNVLRPMQESDPENFDKLCRLMFVSILSECAKAFERLPILMHSEIIRNVLYSGVWTKYEYIQLKKNKKQKNGKEKQK